MIARRSTVTGRALPRAVRETGPLLHEDELSRAARVLSKAAQEARRAQRSAWVQRHVAALLASIEAGV